MCGVYKPDTLLRVLLNEVMALFNRSGNKGKRALMRLQLFSVMRDSVMASHAHATEAEICAAMASHLKYAPDRRGGAGRWTEELNSAIKHRVWTIC
ncbi:hypothetical protein GJAV_G00055140 [Gymnothorax javanicus]|nr:hypothetical protein GJAV_G00055140 [Gymnothorax javanicus]